MGEIKDIIVVEGREYVSKDLFIELCTAYESIVKEDSSRSAEIEELCKEAVRIGLIPDEEG